MDPAIVAKKLEYEERKARAKALRLRLTCTICGARPKTLLNCPCGTTQYCSVDCQRIDWRDRGHRKACKKIRNERAAEAARAEAPTPPPSPPEKVVFYGPAPRSHADEVRARIAAEHEAARARREANPEREPVVARFGSRCPVCFEEWDVNLGPMLRPCCCRTICEKCENKIGNDEPCPLCRASYRKDLPTYLALIRRHAENDVPEAITELGDLYRDGSNGLVKSMKKSAKFYKRAVELGNVEAMANLGNQYLRGEGVKLDRKKAMELFRMAQNRGHAYASCALANLVEKDDCLEAFRLYKFAAERGHAIGCYSVGRCYDIGQGTEEDLDEAKRWYERAAANGYEPSRDRLAALEALDEARRRRRGT